jgi:hypothetical protein
VRRVFCEEAAVVISNTGDTGYRVEADDLRDPVPASFSGKLLALLHARFSANGRPLTILPCELVSRNGAVLKRIMLELQTDHYPDSAFRDWLADTVIWANTWSTGSFLNRWNRRARLRNPTRYGPSRRSRASPCPAGIPTFCWWTI